VRDPVIAAERDRRMLAQRAEDQTPAKIRLPGITDGFLAQRSGPGRGELSTQGFVDRGAGRDRLDAVVGHGFHLLINAELLHQLDGDGTLAALKAAEVCVVAIADKPRIDGAVADVDGTYRRWFAEYGCVAVAVRPDFYVYGTAADVTAARSLAADLVTALDGSARGNVAAL